MDSPLLKLLESVASRAKEKGRPVVDAMATIAHSPVVNQIVAETPNLYDDLVLGFAKAFLPVPKVS